jgi:hypothetical protein
VARQLSNSTDRELRFRGPLCLLALLCFIFGIGVTEAAAAPRGIPITTDNYFVIETDKGTCECALQGTQWRSGVVTGQGDRFLIFVDEVRRLQRSIPKLKGSKKKQAQRTRTRYNTLKKRCETICAVGRSPSAQPTATPTPAPGQPTPTPTPPGGGSSCYNSNRDTSCFGIPQGMVGNENAGQTRWSVSPGCVGCHGPGDVARRNRTFLQVQTALQEIPAMQPVECDAQCIADIVAYLNRFNLNQ